MLNDPNVISKNLFLLFPYHVPLYCEWFCIFLWGQLVRVEINMCFSFEKKLIDVVKIWVIWYDIFFLLFSYILQFSLLEYQTEEIFRNFE